MRKKILAVMLALCMVVTMIPVFALAEEDLDVVIGNNGYPYGQEMGIEQITLLIDAVNATSYQWQEADTADSDGWTDLNVSESKESKVTFTPENNKWYRCVVNGIESYPVQALKVGSTGDNCYKFTKAFNGQWYIGNGAMAYFTNFTSSVKGFDIVGKYIVPDGSYAGIYWANTSFNRYWSVGSHKDPSESMSSYENTNLEKLTLYFDPQNDRSVFVDMKLGENYNAAAFGTDTMLGNDNNSGSPHPFYYDDSASLKAVFENGIFKQVQMVGALSLEEADEEDIAFVVTPITSNAIFWIGAYNQETKGEAYNYNLGNSSYNEYYTFGTGIQSDFDSYVTEIQNRDSALAISWKNLTPNSTVSFAFSIGTVAQTGATVSGSVIGSATDIVTLNVSEDLTDVNQIVIKRGEEILEQGEDKDYTVDLSDPDNPKIKFNEFAGLNVSSGDLTVTITFSGGNTSSAIITNEIPGTGNVSDELGTIEGIESEGLGNIAKEEEKDIVLIVKEEVAVEEDAEQEAIKAKAGDKTIEFLDITLKDRNISNPLEALIESVSKPLEIAIPFNADGKYNITVYRYHNEKAKAFTKLDEKPAENARVDGTFYIDNVNNKIYIYFEIFNLRDRLY
ncbi:MAG: hypothetical protein E7228_04775 [Clostridiales bacterium]|nr:hypothetical protein [Clostridiales bacterium]